GFGIEFYSPALDDGVFLYGISLPYTFDNDLNGVLSANQFPPFEGVYELTGHVYTDPGNASGSVCASSSASVTVTFYTESDQACNPEPTCEVSNLTISGPTELCPGETTTASVSVPSTIPAGGGFGIAFYSPALDDEVFLYGVTLPYSFDNNLNGVLSSNGLPPFEGEYQLTGHVYTDPDNASETVCASSAAPVTVTFYTESDQECNPEPTCETNSLTVTGANEICPGETTTVSLPTPATIPAGGGYAIEFYSPTLDDGVFLYGITLPYTFDNDLNGVLSSNSLPLFEGEYQLTGHVYTNPSDAQGSVCASSSASVSVTFFTATDEECISEPICESTDLVIDGPEATCPEEITTIDAIEATTIPDGGEYAILIEGPAHENGLFLYEVELPYSFDNDLNGVLSDNGFATFEGEYEITGHVYSDAGDPQGSVCATTENSVFITFYSEEEEDCVVSTSDADNGERPVVFPNPTNDVLNISWSTVPGGTGTIRLTDIQGKNILTENATASDLIHGVELDVRSVEPGVYMLLFEYEEGHHAEKVIITR
ncbi:MAG TPA: T9SS type A sorting domain-containing protein, partial [Cryomorphaceae bacterium]|nr:T9SS type A sorting domain-containing protein [Cryomorphaceae bacterium]